MNAVAWSESMRLDFSWLLCLLLFLFLNVFSCDIKIIRSSKQIVIDFTIALKVLVFFWGRLKNKLINNTRCLGEEKMFFDNSLYFFARSRVNQQVVLYFLKERASLLQAYGCQITHRPLSSAGVWATVPYTNLCKTISLLNTWHQRKSTLARRYGYFTK